MISIHDGPDPELAGHWRALPIWQRWALIHVADGITLKTWMRDEDEPVSRFCICAKRRPGGDTWECEIATHLFEDTGDTDFVIVHVLRGMREDFLLPEAEQDAAALRRLRAMASSIAPNETPAPATYAWVKS